MFHNNRKFTREQPVTEDRKEMESGYKALAQQTITKGPRSARPREQRDTTFSRKRSEQGWRRRVSRAVGLCEQGAWPRWQSTLQLPISRYNISHVFPGAGGPQGLPKPSRPSGEWVRRPPVCSCLVEAHWDISSGAVQRLWQRQLSLATPASA